jgi:clan AA aspartic protease (TIGR02281 family)
MRLAYAGVPICLWTSFQLSTKPTGGTKQVGQTGLDWETMRKGRLRGIAAPMVAACAGLTVLGGCAQQNVSHSVAQAQSDFYPPGAAVDGGQTAQRPPDQPARSDSGVSLKQSGGTFLVPVTINNTVEMSFVVDSGASDVSIPADVVSILRLTGTISEDDFLGQRTYRLADGSVVPTPTFRLRSVKVGDKVLRDVTGSVALGSGGLLLGQSFLSRFHSWSIDNERKVLVLDYGPDSIDLKPECHGGNEAQG